MLAYIVIIILALWTLQRVKQGKVRMVRMLPGIAGIQEAISRCAETARPCFLTTGLSGRIYGHKGPDHMAGIAILSLVAKFCARLGVNLITCWPHPEMLPIAEDTVYQSYFVEGKAEEFRKEYMVRYLGGGGFKINYMGLLTRENAGANILCGSIWASDALQLMEPGAMIGALQIGGANDMSTISMLALVCDYTFIGEELYSAGALASENPFQLATLFASDMIKIGLILLMIVGVFLTSAMIDVSPIFGI